MSSEGESDSPSFFATTSSHQFRINGEIKAARIEERKAYR